MSRREKQRRRRERGVDLRTAAAPDWDDVAEEIKNRLRNKSGDLTIHQQNSTGLVGEIKKAGGEIHFTIKDVEKKPDALYFWYVVEGPEYNDKGWDAFYSVNRSDENFRLAIQSALGDFPRTSRKRRKRHSSKELCSSCRREREAKVTDWTIKGTDGKVYGTYSEAGRPRAVAKLFRDKGYSAKIPARGRLQVEVKADVPLADKVIVEDENGLSEPVSIVQT